ncbi:MAG: hypothetical protein AAGA62_18855, partial [Bacteroidota bacterium]
PGREHLRTRHPYLGLALALLVASPNLYWQYSLDWPVIRHMEELSRTQLVNMTAADFLIPQFLFHWTGLFVWGAGLWALLRWEQLRPYRFLAWAWVGTLILLLLLSGKAYYTIGAFSALLAAGAVAWEKWLKHRTWVLLPCMLFFNAFIIPFGMPTMPVEQMQAYSRYMRDNYQLTPPLRWEDGVVRDLPQDFADMHGWQELPAKVATFYHSLPPEEKAQCLLYGGNYGQAGVLNFHRQDHDLPECYSFSSSFTMWVPEEVSFQSQIQIDDRWQSSSDYFEEVIFIDSIDYPLARDPGYIFYKRGAKTDLSAAWKQIVREQKRADGLIE